MIKKVTFILLSIIVISCTKKEKKHSDEFIKIQNELTEKLTEISKITDFNGFCVALVNEEEVLYQNGFGVANLEGQLKYTDKTVQNIASV